MPTKLNKAGNQQNYVPAGNGDASGEYGDNADGSNIHFKSFAKPKDEIKEETKEGGHIGVDIEDNGNSSDVSDFDNYVDQKLTYNKKEFNDSLKKLYKSGQQEGKDIISKVLQNGNLSYYESSSDCCNLYSGSIDLSSTALGTGGVSSHYVEGEVFYHETGHAIDGNYVQFGEGAGNSRGRKFYYLPQSASETFITSTGKTLCDTLKGQQKPPIRERIKEAKKDLEEYKLKWYKENKPELAEKMEQLLNFDKEIENDPEYKKYQSTIDELNSKNRLSSFEKSKLYHAILERDEIQRTYKFDEKRQLREDLRVSDYEFEKEKHKTFGDISDMFCMQGYGYVFGMGHSSSYAKQDTNKRGHEFFAECFSAENTNPESLKLIKKHFPEGYKAYREIIDAIKSGKLKTNKQQNEVK